MDEPTTQRGVFDRFTSALANFRGEDDLARYNTLGLAASEDLKATRSTSGGSHAHHHGMDGGFGASFERHLQAAFGHYAGTRVDYAKEMGDLTQSSLVMTAVNWLGIALPEAPLEVVEALPGRKTNLVEEHALTLLLEQPNPHYSGELLWMAFALSWLIDGNVYWWKIRNALGEVMQLWPLPHFLVEPRWNPSDDTVFITHYAYLVNGTEWPIPPADIIHFRHGIDLNNPRRGMSPVASLLREIYGDNEASNASALLMKNCGVFPFVISPKESRVSVEDGDLAKLKEEFVRRTSGDERGKPIVNGIGVEVQKLAFSPVEMDLKELRRLPEERLAAVIGIPAIVLNFGAGLDRSTFANYAEAREAAYESKVIPTQRVIAGQLNLQLLPERIRVQPRKNRFKVRHDLTQVRVLQDDQNKLFTRLTAGYRGGWIKLSEARSAAGFRTTPEEETYFSQTISKPVNNEEPMKPPGDAASDKPPDGEDEKCCACHSYLDTKAR